MFLTQLTKQNIDYPLNFEGSRMKTSDAYVNSYSISFVSRHDDTFYHPEILAQTKAVLLIARGILSKQNQIKFAQINFK